MTHDFPTLAEVIAMHDSLIREFGGSHGIRDSRKSTPTDEGGFGIRPTNASTAWLPRELLVQEAAALMESLAT